MIDPAKLTAENGFVDGCVVEIVWDDRNKYPEYTKWFRSDWDGWEIEQAESIRPLSGPMAIWNFAPERADVLLTSGKTFYQFFTDEKWNKWKELMLDGKHDIVTTRPFWARSEK